MDLANLADYVLKGPSVSYTASVLIGGWDKKSGPYACVLYPLNLLPPRLQFVKHPVIWDVFDINETPILT